MKGADSNLGCEIFCVFKMKGTVYERDRLRKGNFIHLSVAEKFLQILQLKDFYSIEFFQRHIMYISIWTTLKGNCMRLPVVLI